MKRLLGLTLAFVLAVALAVSAFAAYCEPDEAYPGTKVVLYGFEDSSGGSCWDYGDSDYLNYEYYSLRTSWTSGSGSYIQKCAIDEKTGEVYLIISTSLSSGKEKEITGTVTLVEKESLTKYTLTLYSGDLTVNPGGSTNTSSGSRMEDWGDREFGLPGDYQTKAVRFVTASGENYGKLLADFGDDAYFKVTVADQPNLFLGYHTSSVAAVTNKYPRASLRFVSWTSRPAFDMSGTLGIYMDADEWIYGVDTNGAIYSLGGKYNTSTRAYEVSTKTLGSYVISDIQLSATAASSSSSSAAPPPSSSSAAPPSSSTPPSSSSSSSSSSESSSSEAPPPSSSETPPSSPSSQQTGGSADQDSGGGFLIPVLFGVLAVLIVALLFVFFGGKRGGKPRFDDWDD